MSEHIEHLLSGYMDNELTEHERNEVERHLTACPRCRGILSDLIDIQGQVVAAFQTGEVPESIEDRVLHTIRAEASAPVSKNNRVWLLVPIASVILLIAAAFALTGSFLIKLTSITGKVLLNLIYAFGSVLGADPLIMAGLLGVSFILIIVSGISLKHLLKTRTI